MAVDQAGEWRELSERYHQMSDEELTAITRQKSDLTDAAQQALGQEISYRKLIVPVEEEEAVEAIPQTDPDSPYAEDRELVDIRTVWSLADARQIEWLLTRAGIPFFMGPENATMSDRVTSNFSAGVSVRVMRIGWYWAKQALRNYAPMNEPESEVVEDPDPVAVVCPRCRSEEIVLRRLVPVSSSRFKWRCDSCGYEWEDDGVAKDSAS